MQFEDIHGIDWRFTSPSGEQEVFPVAGYGAKNSDLAKAEQFERDHPEWEKSVERF